MTDLYFAAVAISFWTVIVCGFSIISFEMDVAKSPQWWRDIRNRWWIGVLILFSLFVVVAPLILLFALPELP